MNLNVQEKIASVHQAYDYQCFCCGGASNQLAHIIPKYKRNIDKYGEEIIHNELNLLPACCLECNDTALIGQNWEGQKKLVELIEYVIDTSSDWKDFIDERDDILGI